MKKLLLIPLGVFLLLSNNVLCQSQGNDQQQPKTNNIFLTVKNNNPGDTLTPQQKKERDIKNGNFTHRSMGYGTNRPVNNDKLKTSTFPKKPTEP